MTYGAYDDFDKYDQERFFDDEDETMIDLGGGMVVPLSEVMDDE